MPPLFGRCISDPSTEYVQHKCVHNTTVCGEAVPAAGEMVRGVGMGGGADSFASLDS